MQPDHLKKIQHYSDMSGFTLIEMIVVMVFAAIILTIAVPNFNTLIRNNTLATQANELVSALSLARR